MDRYIELEVPVEFSWNLVGDIKDPKIIFEACKLCGCLVVNRVAHDRRCREE